MEQTSLFDFRGAFIQNIEATQRVFSHDRSKTLGASETFGCLRRSWFSKFAPNLADKAIMSMGAAERGNVIENHFVVPKLYSIFGRDRVLFAGDDQQTLVKGLNSATPDALIFPERRDVLKKYGVDDIGSDCFGTEIKSFDPRMNLQEEKFVHRGQGIIQMGLFEETTKYRPQYNIILYINAADFYDIRTFVVSKNDDVYATAKARATAVFEATDAYQLKAEGVHNGQCRYCLFQGACRDSELSKFPSTKELLTDNEIKTLTDMAHRYTELGDTVKEAEKTRSEVSEEIKRFLNAVGTKGASVPGFTVAYSKMDGRETVDTDAMEADGIDLSPYMKRGKGYTRLQVTQKNDT